MEVVCCFLIMTCLGISQEKSMLIERTCFQSSRVIYTKYIQNKHKYFDKQKTLCLVTQYQGSICSPVSGTFSYKKIHIWFEVDIVTSVIIKKFKRRMDFSSLEKTPFLRIYKKKYVGYFLIQSYIVLFPVGYKYFTDTF